MTPEKIIQSQIIEYFKKLYSNGHKCIIERRQAGGFNYKMGIPDLYAVYNGIHIEIEVKAPGKTLRSMQEKYRDKCKALNILWCCIDNMTEMKKFMLRHFNVIPTIKDIELF